MPLREKENLDITGGAKGGGGGGYRIKKGPFKRKKLLQSVCCPQTEKTAVFWRGAVRDQSNDKMAAMSS